ncbi:MAG TPA: protein kinase [Gemmatimonadaceae bacterium]|nr:protein kinase [Gemmatimonadaceae bacterium]
MSDVKICPTCGSEYPVSERFCPRDGTALRSQSGGADLVGTVIADRYHVIKKLGEGGMGAVYLAEHVKMGRKSAIKVMNPGTTENADAIARFNREASNASRMNHPNICAIYDFGETSEGLIYLAMEFIEGDALTKLIETNGALAPARAASILHQTADALQVAHDYGIVHRDLKPDNIMIARGRDNADVVKVVDFGIAKAHTSDAQKVTKTGLVVGTPEYMSPEQLAGDKLDGRSDIYSLALVGFNMLTGTLPFPSTSAQESMIMRLTDAPKTLMDMRPNVAWPPQLQAVMDKALSRDANARYQKAADFGREFSMAIDAMPSSALTEAGTVVMGAQGAASSAPTAAIPKTNVARASTGASSTPRSARTVAQPASTPVAKKGAKSLIGVGVGIAGVVVLAIGYTSNWFGLAGNGANTQTNPPNVGTKIDSSANKVAGNGGAGDGSKQTDPPITPANNTQKQTQNPSGGNGDARGNADAGANRGGAPAVQSYSVQLAQYKVIMDAVDSTRYRPSLREIARIIDLANPAEKGQLLYYQAAFAFDTNDFDLACAAATAALRSTSLDTDQRSVMAIMRGQEQCRGKAPA